MGYDARMIQSVSELEEQLAVPSAALVKEMSNLDGDILVLGAGGKMGPSLVKLALNAIEQAGVKKEVTAVSRFGITALREDLEQAGAKIIALDLLQPGAVEKLPRVENVLHMVAMKFGTAGNEYLTWAQNAFLPGLVARHFATSRIVAFSTGNVYPLTPVTAGGSRESDPVGPVGEYAQSCLGRERLFEYGSYMNGTPVLLYRLNYAVELRYGTLVDIATAISRREPIDVSMGHMNVIWQGDANEIALRALGLCSSPPSILNVTGPETVAVRSVARQLGERLGIEPILVGEEQETALLNNAGRAHALFGYPSVSLETMIDWVAHWVASGRETHGKPTKFSVRSGEF